jgi:hypothetical protein
MTITFTIQRHIKRDGVRVGKIETDWSERMQRRSWWCTFLASSGIREELPIPRFPRLKDAKAAAIKFLTETDEK